MRIAHVTASLSRRGAGVREVVLHLARAQAAQGHDVAVIGLSDADFARADRADWQGLSVTACRARGPAAAGFAPAMGRALDAAAPDIVHLHGLWMYPGAAVLGWHRRSGRPYALSVHGMLSEVALGYSPAKKRLARALFQDRALASAACLHATGPAERAELRAFGLTGPVLCLPNGVAAAPVPPRPAPGGARTVLSLGRLHRKKGLDVLLDAWARIEAAHPGWRLALVGPDEGGHGAELAAQARRLGLARCTISGPVHGAARDAALAAADLFVLPTRSENFALTVAESLMMQVPVIASHGAPWLGLESEGCGLWVPLGAASLAGAMDRLMRLPGAERRAMGARGRAWMLRDFGWDGIAARMGCAYRWMQGTAPAPADLDMAAAA